MEEYQKWKYGRMPEELNADDYIKIMTRDRKTTEGRAGDFIWTHKFKVFSEDDIIFYKRRNNENNND